MKETDYRKNDEGGADDRIELKSGLNAILMPELGGYGNLPQPFEQTRLELQRFLDKLDHAGGTIMAAFPVKIDMGRPPGYASNITETRMLFVIKKER